MVQEKGKDLRGRGSHAGPGGTEWPPVRLPGLRGTYSSRTGGGCEGATPAPGQPCPPGTFRLPGRGAGPAAESPLGTHHWAGRRWPRRHRGRNPRAVHGERGQGRGGHGTPCRTGDIGGRASGQRGLGYQILAGTGPGPQGPGQSQKPLERATGSGPGASPQRGCRVPSELPAPRPACPWACHRERGNVPNMASVPSVSSGQRVQAASRAGSPAGDNLFHGSYAYGTAPASESTRAFPRNEQ